LPVLFVSLSPVSVSLPDSGFVAGRVALAERQRNFLVVAVDFDVVFGLPHPRFLR